MNHEIYATRYARGINHVTSHLLVMSYKLFQHYKLNTFIEDVEHVCGTGMATRYAALN